MATGSSSNSGIEDNQAYTHRCHNLITNVGGMVYRHILQNELNYRRTSLEEFLKNNKQAITDLKPNRDLLNVLFPRNEAAKTDAEFDISAIAFLLRNFFTKDGETLHIGFYRSGDPTLIDGNTRAWNLSVDDMYPWKNSVIYDIIRIKEYRNKIHHIVNTKKWLTEIDFKRHWCGMSAALLSLGRVFGIPNMFFEIETVLRENLDPKRQDETPKMSTMATEPDNLKECSAREMAFRQKSFSDVFVETEAYRNISRRLQEKKIVVISGNHGEGKSTIALKLISEHYSKGYRILKTPEDWRSVSTETCDVILIDDMFGIAVLDESDLKNWQRYLNEMQQADGVFIIITIKPHILQQVKKRIPLKLWTWFDDNVEKVISEKMSNDERRDILKSHLNVNGREVNNVSLDDCLTKYTNQQSAMFNIGFPQCASMYAKYLELFENSGFTFFEKPIYFIKNCLRDMLNGDTNSFSAFSFLWSQSNQTVTITEVENKEKDEHSEISRRLKLCKVPSSSFVKDTLLLYKDGFINYIEDNEEFRFSHDIIADVVGLLVCEKDINNGINLCSLDFLMTYVTTADITDNERIVKVYITKSRFELLLKRLLYFYRSNKKVLSHDAFGNENFVSELQKREDVDLKIFEIFHDACTEGASNTVSCMLKCGIEGHEVEGFSPIHMAANSGHYKIVSLFAEKNPELLKLKISGGENISQKYRGATILHIAVLNGFDAMINEFFKHADVKLRDCEGNTPLLLSIKERKNKITRIFLTAQDAEINTPDFNLSTPLMEAVKNKSLKIVKMLLSYKVKDINCLNMNNQTALDIAHLKEDNKIVKKLKDYGAKTAKELTDLNE